VAELVTRGRSAGEGPEHGPHHNVYARPLSIAPPFARTDLQAAHHDPPSGRPSEEPARAFTPGVITARPRATRPPTTSGHARKSPPGARGPRGTAPSGRSAPGPRPGSLRRGSDRPSSSCRALARRHPVHSSPLRGGGPNQWGHDTHATASARRPRHVTRGSPSIATPGFVSPRSPKRGTRIGAARHGGVSEPSSSQSALSARNAGRTCPPFLPRGGMELSSPLTLCRFRSISRELFSDSFQHSSDSPALDFEHASDVAHRESETMVEAGDEALALRQQVLAILHSPDDRTVDGVQPRPRAAVGGRQQPGYISADGSAVISLRTAFARRTHRWPPFGGRSSRSVIVITRGSEMQYRVGFSGRAGRRRSRRMCSLTPLPSAPRGTHEIYHMNGGVSSLGGARLIRIGGTWGGA